MTKWEYVTVPLLVHATKQILDNWGQDGWELVQVVPGLNPENLVAYLKRPIRGRRETGLGAAGRAGSDAAAGAAPVAAYVPAVRFGDLVFTSGQLPMVDGQLRRHRQGRRRGDAGARRTPAPGLRRSTAWRRWPTRPVSVDVIARIVKVVVFVASAPGFTGQPQVGQRGQRAARRDLRRGRSSTPAVRSGVAACRWTRRSRWSWSSRSASGPRHPARSERVALGWPSHSLDVLARLIARSCRSGWSSGRRPGPAQSVRLTPRSPPAWSCCATAAAGPGDLPAASARPDGVRGVDGGVPGWRARPGRSGGRRPDPRAARSGRPRRRPGSSWRPTSCGRGRTGSPRRSSRAATTPTSSWPSCPAGQQARRRVGRDRRAEWSTPAAALAAERAGRSR